MTSMIGLWKLRIWKSYVEWRRWRSLIFLR